jgi:hypothetical protein
VLDGREGWVLVKEARHRGGTTLGRPCRPEMSGRHRERQIQCRAPLGRESMVSHDSGQSIYSCSETRRVRT